MSTRQQGIVLFTAILFLVATTVVIQLWLLTVSMEAILSGVIKTLPPAAAASTVLLCVNAGLIAGFALRFEPLKESDRVFSGVLGPAAFIETV